MVDGLFVCVFRELCVWFLRLMCLCVLFVIYCVALSGFLLVFDDVLSLFVCV